jgi:hypothetical protein
MDTKDVRFSISLPAPYIDTRRIVKLAINQGDHQDQHRSEYRQHIFGPLNKYHTIEEPNFSKTHKKSSTYLL